MTGVVRSPGFALRRQCGDCPFRADVPVDAWPLAEYVKLVASCLEGPEAIMSCHKTPTEAPAACVGFLEAHGLENWRTRLGAREGHWRPGEMELAGPQRGGLRELVRLRLAADESNPRRRRRRAP